MTPTFLVQLDVGSDTDLTSIASEVEEELTASGFSVLEVKPWSQHNTLGGSLLPQPPQGGILPTT